MSGLNDINKQEPRNVSNHSQLVAPPQCMQASHRLQPRENTFVFLCLTNFFLSTTPFLPHYHTNFPVKIGSHVDLTASFAEFPYTPARF